ncbi:MAG: glucose-6-phosphate dehydrogenase assembly protein OpcA [Chlamydiales bacterium]
MATTVEKIINITTELTKLWDKEQGENKIRASLFNLIVYVHKDERLPLHLATIQNVVAKFPCRVIMIIHDTSSHENYIQSSVSSQTIVEGNNQIYCELIQISVAGSFLQRVPFIVIPNIQADLPVYLLWTEDPTEECTIMPRLGRTASRIIFDAEKTESLQKYSRAILDLSEKYNAEIGDLHWSALFGWRRIFAETFNDRKTLSHLQECHTIHIVFNSSEDVTHQHTDIRAAYLQSWLATCMGWTLKSCDKGKLTYTDNKQKIKVHIRGTNASDLPPGTVVSVEIESDHNGAHYIFKKEAGGRQIYCQFSDNEMCSLPFRHYLGGVKEGQEIINEIFYPAPKEHYFAMIRMLANTKWRCE